MKPWLRITLKISAALSAVLILLWVGMAIYVSRNTEKIRETLLVKLNNNLSGNISIGNIEPSLLRGFPGVALGLSDISVTDSLISQHKQELLHAKSVYVSLNVFSLLTGKTNIRRIQIHDAQILIFTDSNGYTNSSVFKAQKPTKSKTDEEANNLEIRNIDFKNVRLIIDDHKKGKKFDFKIQKLLGKIRYPIGGFKGKIDLKTQVNTFSFNTERGSFLKDKPLNGTLEFEYNTSDQLIKIEPNRLDIGKDKFTVGATIHSKTGGFHIEIHSDNILFKNIARLLAPNISEKLLRFDIDRAVEVRGNIRDDGSKKNADPLINVTLKAKNSKVTIPSGFLEKANFVGKFTNQQHAGKPIGDENSLIEFNNLSADYYNIPIKIDTFFVVNLSRPQAIGRVKANFPISNLNKTIGSGTMDFKGGTVHLDLYCKADIDNFKFTKPFINGAVQIKDADVVHKPTKTRLTNNALSLRFNDKDLKLNNSQLQMGKSFLNMDLEIKNFLNLYYTDPEQIDVNIKLNSSQINLEELIPFLSPRRNKKKKNTGGNQINAFVNQFETIFEQSKMNIQLNVEKAVFKRFVANKLNANISMIGTTVNLSNISVNHAGGFVRLNGHVKHNGRNNIFQINSTVQRVNVRDFFYAFEDFGQDGITSKNIQGILSAQANVSGTLNNTGNLVPKSIKGNVNVNLRNAALINFDPMIKAGKFAFANRDFSNITMKNLEARLKVNGEKIQIEPLEISSSVINMNVAGMYSMGKGTDLALDIPLRNPDRDINLSAGERKKNRMKGVVLRLRALDGDDGKVKIRWNSNRNKSEK